jgi:predicted ATPase/DNA-binding SARP family transcriptional activator
VTAAEVLLDNSALEGLWAAEGVLGIACSDLASARARLRHNHAMAITVRILGPVTLDALPDNTSLSPKLRLLLALLAVHRGSVVSVDRLCDALWGDQQPAGAAATLQSHLSRLRRLLAPDAHIVSLDRGYRLDLPDGALDVDRFELAARRAGEAGDQLEAASLYQSALAWWSGPAFGDLADVDWLRPEAVRLDELRLTVVEAWIQCRLDMGGDARLIGDLEGLMLTSPFRERFARQLMVALFRDGRQADALRRASDFRRLVRDHTGLDASAALTSIEAQILSDDYTLLRRSDPPPRVRPRPTLTDGPTRLVGRTLDLARIIEAIGSSRLVTLSGPGGVGKTRLARRIAATATGFADGAAFVELSAMGETDSLADVVATALDVQPRQHLTMEESVIEALADQQQLVVFDNCEHLLDALVPFVDRVRALCPRVHILTTSRESLGLPGEMVLTVSPLAVGKADDADLNALLSSPAVELLLDRIAAAVPGFALTADNAIVIGEICRRLDGLPLALELVAARFRSLPPDTILQRLMVPAVVLGASMRSAEPRHRTLRDTIAWSFEHLTSAEQIVYARLSCFAGSFDLAAVESVCASSAPHTDSPDTGAVPDTADVVEVLTALVDKSMVQVVGAGAARYQLLETLREFGKERLIEQGAVEVIEQRHLEWFADLAARSSRGMTGPDEAEWSQRVDSDFDNFRTAFGHAVRTSNVDVALRITAALREFAFRRIRYELTAWAATSVAMPGASEHPRYPTVLAIVSYGHFVRGELSESIGVAGRAIAAADELGVDTGGLAERTLVNAWFYLGGVDEAMHWADQMVASARTGSTARLAHALYMRSVAETSTGRSVQGAIMAGEAKATARACGSPTAQAQAAYALGLALEGSDPAESLRLLRDSARLARAAGNRWVEAFAHTEVWWLEAQNGDVRTALSGSGIVIDTWHRGGDWANLRLSLRRVFGLLMQIGDHRTAAVLHGALNESGAEAALPFEPHDAEDVEAAVRELGTALGPEPLRVLMAEGVNLSDSELVHLVQTRIAAHIS